MGWASLSASTAGCGDGAMLESQGKPGKELAPSAALWGQIRGRAPLWVRALCGGGEHVVSAAL